MQTFRHISLAFLLAVVGGHGLLADDTPSDDVKPEDAQTSPDTAASEDPKPDDAKPDDAKPDDPKPDDPKPGDAKPPAGVDVLAEWDQLTKRKLQIAETLRDLKQRFPLATKTEKADIRAQFGSRIDEYDLLAAKMDKLAKDVLAKRPDDPEAAAIRMREEFDANHYADALTLAETVLDAGDDMPYDLSQAKRVAAASSFALHDFQRAAALLAEVEHAPGWTRSSSLEKPSLEPAAKDYIEFWKEEQAIRAKEVALEGDEALPRVKFEIVDADGGSKGTVEVLLFANEAPNTVASFVKSVKGGDYNGRPFTRVIPNFMVQGGQLEPEAPWSIACECYEKNARKHFRGSLSMVTTGPDTGDSEFMITVVPTHTLNAVLTDDGEPFDGQTVFGRVVTGMDVVDDVIASDKIAKATMVHERPGMPEPVRENEAEPETTTPDPKEGDGKPSDDKPTTPKPTTPKPDEPKRDEPKPDDANPFEPKPDDAKPDDAKPDDAKPGDVKPKDVKPEESNPFEPKPEGDAASPSDSE